MARSEVSHERHEVCPRYTRRAFDVELAPDTVEWAAQEVQASGVQAIVACGHSGLLVAGAVSYITKIPVFAVRKKGELDAVVGSGGMVSGIAPHGAVREWAFLDDLISSGGTLVHSAKSVYDKALVLSPVPAVVLLYQDNGQDRTVKLANEWRWDDAFDNAKLLRGKFYLVKAMRNHPAYKSLFEGYAY